MSDIAIHIENLGKRYRIGARETGYKTFREAVIEGIKSPLKNFKNLRALTRFDDNGPDADIIWALQDVNLDVRAGEVIAIIGPNGAGKSTLLKVLSRVTEPTTGSAEIHGRVSSLLEVGTGFHPELTGRENVYLNGTVLGMRKKEIDRKFDEIVDFSGVEKFIDTPVKRYSSGMQVRLAFSVAAHLEPEILIIDEVLAVGDVAFQKKCLGKMGEVGREGRTVLFVSHNMDAVRKLCTHAYLLENGCIKTGGVTDKVIEDYLRAGTSALSANIALPPGQPDAPAMATRLRVLAPDGTPRAQFKLWEPWRLNLEFEVYKPTAHFIAAVGLVNSSSIAIVTYWSQPKDLAPGRYHVEFSCDLPLASSNIQFVVGLSSYENSFYYAQDINGVSVSEVALEDQPLRTSGAGLLLSDQKCEIKQLPMVKAGN